MVMKLSWDDIFDRLIGHEGDYSNDPNDPGGETKWGICKREYPDLDIPNLTRDDAKSIFYRDFWCKLRAEELPEPIAFQLFDFAVNSGVQTSIRYFQRALKIADDGHWGPISQQAVEMTTVTDIIMRLNAERLEYMTKLKNWPFHGRGWARRIANNLRYGAEDS
jgi:lysozyme family protein